MIQAREIHTYFHLVLVVYLLLCWDPALPKAPPHQGSELHESRHFLAVGVWLSVFTQSLPAVAGCGSSAM